MYDLIRVKERYQSRMLPRFPKIRRCDFKCTGLGVVEIEFEGADNYRAEDSHQLLRGAAQPLTKTGLMIGTKPDAARKPVFLVLFNWLVYPLAFPACVETQTLQAVEPTGIVFRRCATEKRIRCSFLAAGRIQVNDYYTVSNVCNIYWPLLSSYRQAIPLTVHSE